MSSSIEEEDEGNLTRKQRREQARAERKAIEEEHAARAPTRRTRLTTCSEAPWQRWWLWLW